MCIVDLAPGLTTTPVALDATGQDLRTWGVHPETGSGGDSSDAVLDPGSVKTLTCLTVPGRTAATQEAGDTDTVSLGASTTLSVTA